MALDNGLREPTSFLSTRDSAIKRNQEIFTDTTKDDSAFTKGLRSGTTRSRAAFDALGARIAETTGNEEKAAELTASSRRESALADVQAPPIGRIEDINFHDEQGKLQIGRGLRDLGSFTAGTAGSSIAQLPPAIVGGVAGGVVAGPAGAVAGAVTGLAPGFVAESVLGTEEDPVAAGKPLLTRNIADVTTGVAQAVVAAGTPTFLAAKFLAKRGAEKSVGVALQSNSKIIAKNLAGVSVLEGATELAEGEIGRLKADILNPDRDRSEDTSARLNEVAGGVLLGGLFSPIGTVGDIRARNAARTQAPAAKAAPTDGAAADAPPTGPTPFAGFRDAVNEARTLDGAPSDEEFNAARTPAEQEAVLRKFDRAQENSSARQADEGISFLEKLQASVEGARKLNAESPGINETSAAIFEALNEANPGVFKQGGTDFDNKVLQRAAISVLGSVERARKTGIISNDELMSLRSVLGNNFVSALRKVDAASPGTAPGGRTNLFTALERADKVQNDVNGIQRILIENAVDQEFIDTLSRAQLDFITNQLVSTLTETRQLAASETDAAGNPLNAKQQKIVFDNLVLNALEQDFGPNAVFVADEITKLSTGLRETTPEAAAEVEPTVEPGAPTEPDVTTTGVAGKGDKKAPSFVGLTLDDPSTKLQLEKIARRDFVRIGGTEGQTEDQFVAEQLNDPNFIEGRLQTAREAIAEASPERAAELNQQLQEGGLDSETVGFVVDIQAEDPLRLSTEELASVRAGVIDPETGARKIREGDTRRIKVDKGIFDATRLVNVFRKKAPTEKNTVQLFKEGLAALIAQSAEGKVEVDFDGVILDGKNTRAALPNQEQGIQAQKQRAADRPIAQIRAAIQTDINTLEVGERTPEKDSKIRVLNERIKNLQKSREDFKTLLLETSSEAGLEQIAAQIETTLDARLKKLFGSTPKGKKLTAKSFADAGVTAAEDFLSLVQNEVFVRKGFTQEVRKPVAVTKDARPQPVGGADPEARLLETGQQEADPFGGVLQQFGKVKQLFVDNAGLPINTARIVSKGAQPLAIQLGKLHNRLNDVSAVKRGESVTRQLATARKVLRAMRRIGTMNEVTQARLATILATNKKGLAPLKTLDEMNTILDSAINAKEVKQIDPVKELVQDLRAKPSPAFVNKIIKRVDNTDAEGVSGLVSTAEELNKVKNRSEAQVEVLSAINNRLHALVDNDPALLKQLSLPVKDIEKSQVVTGEDTPVDDGKSNVDTSLEGRRKFSRERVESTTSESTAAQRAEVQQWLKTVVPWVRVQFDKSMGFNSGEFIGGEGAAKSIIKISAFAKNPSSIGFHEAAHEFYRMMNDPKNMGPKGKEVIQDLLKVANSPIILNKMRILLRGQEAALKQLENNPEERVAYMMQFHRTGQLEIGPKTKNIFTKMFNFIGEVFGVWGAQKRAVHIMNVFQSGEFAQFVDTGGKVMEPNAVYESLKKPGTRPVVDKIIKLAEPFKRAGDTIFGASTNRLRGTGINEFDQLMDALYRPSTRPGQDRGFVQAKRVTAERLKSAFMNPIMKFSEKQIQAAFLEQQKGELGSTPDNKIIIASLNKWFAATRSEMQAAGIDVGDRAVRSGYTPWILDMSQLAKNQERFVEMLSQEKYRAAWEAKFGKDLTPAMMVSRIVADNGNIDSSVDPLDDTVIAPGSPRLQPRELAFIEDADMAPFLENDAFRIVTNYADQAAARIEWANRFATNSPGNGFNMNGKIEAAIVSAEKQGATVDQIALLKNVLDSVNGRSGSQITPEWRAVFENTTILQNLAIMPLGIFAQIGDPVIMLSRGATISEAANAYIRSIKDIPRIFKGSKDIVNDEAYQLAEDMNTITNSALSQAMARTGAGLNGFDSANPLLRKANDWLFRFNYMEQFTQTMRVSATESAVNFISRHAVTSRDGSNKNSERFLNELGLKDGDIIMHGSRPLLTAGDFMLRAGMSRTQAEAASQKMISAVNAWVESAVVRPTQTNTPLWSSDPRFLLFAHLKKFTLAFNEVVLKRLATEFSLGNYVPMMSMVAIVPVMMAGDIMKEMLLNGGEPQDRDMWMRMTRAWQRGGLLGNYQYADDFKDQIQQGHTGIDVLGPSIQAFTDLATTALGPGEFTTAVGNQIPLQQIFDSKSFQGIVR